MWHTLALALGGRTVAEWRALMSRQEFVAWVEFYKRHPFDDLHRYHRPAAMIAAAGGGATVEQRLRWLAPDPSNSEWNDADTATLRTLGVLKG